MIKKLLSTALLVSTLTVNAQQVQNPGFETWANSLPASWGSFDQMFVGIGQPNPGTSVQTATAHSGSSAILLQNQFVSLAGGNIPGAICTGPVTLVGGNPVAGFQAYSSLPTSYDFWYQFNALNGDQAKTKLYITHWNTITNKRDTLAHDAGNGTSISGVASVYTHMTVPITWLITSTTPDSIQLTFMSSVQSNTAVPTGGKLYLDDINFTTPAGVETFMADGFFANVYPNPTIDQVFIDANTTDKLNVDLFDVNGKHVFNASVMDKSNINIAALSEGVYSMTIKTENHVATKKLVVLR